MPKAKSQMEVRSRRSQYCKRFRAWFLGIKLICFYCKE